MQKASVESIVSALNQHQVRYLIVGGLAVVAHGYVRFTADLDIILAVDTQNLQRAVKALESLGYKPRAPVAIEQFVDPAARRQWAEEKGMVVFTLFSAAHPATEIDLFIEPPLDFAEAYSRAKRMEVAAGVPATFCGLDDLIELKSKAGRPRDLEDINQLRALHGKQEP